MIDKTIQSKAVQQLLDTLPDRVYSFEGSEYPAPIRNTFLGDEALDINALRADLVRKQAEDVKDLLEPLLLGAELVEAQQDDRAKYFITDRAVQSFVFAGSKWRAGWALVMGGEDHADLIACLRERSFMVFTDRADVPETVYIGNRDTSPIYFLQMMVRYGLIWGRIAPGDDHEMGHFLEKDLPGCIIVCDELPPLKYLVTLGLMKLGAPAIVPSTFPFPYGYRLVADDAAAIMERITCLPNLRQRYHLDEIISLPAPCNPALIHEEIDVDRRLGGGPDSFFCVQPAREIVPRTRTIGQPADQIGISVAVCEQNVSDDIALNVEKAAMRSLNTLPGVHAYEQDGAFYLELSSNANLDGVQWGDVIYWGIRLEYPRLKQINTEVIFDAQVLKARAAEVRAYKQQRRQFVARMNEQNTEKFCVCTECRPFSLVHTCILTPGRMPMCGSRTYASVKAAAYFGSDQVPWTRPSEKSLPMRRVFCKGRLLDPLRGEYEGCNQMYREMTNGQLERVFLHSVREHPLTSCGCFQLLAFWLPEVAGLGIIMRNSPAVTPDGQTWETLANRAGGKQSPGIVGVSHQYVHSPDFLKGDGGMANVVWVDSVLYSRIAKLLTPGQNVATEQQVKTLADLRAFCGR